MWADSSNREQVPAFELLLGPEAEVKIYWSDLRRMWIWILTIKRFAGLDTSITIDSSLPGIGKDDAAAARRQSLVVIAAKLNSIVFQAARINSAITESIALDQGI